MDVGGKIGHRLSPICYTSIAEIKGFRFKFRKDHLQQEEITKKMRYQVPGRPAPIHSALSGGASHIVTACHVPRPIQCRAIMQSKHWALTQRPFCGNPKSSPDAGSFNCTVCGIVPRHKAGAIFPILSRLRHTTPIKARISLTCGVLSAFLVLFRMLSR